VKKYNEDLKKKGEKEHEAWVVYMDTIREIMAKTLGVSLS
jgi:hypothetical protein